MSRKSAVQHAQFVVTRSGTGIHFNFRSSLQYGKRLQFARHRATVKRRNAFLDLQQATAHANRYYDAHDLAKATGGEINPNRRPANVELYLERFRKACEEQRALLKDQSGL